MKKLLLFLLIASSTTAITAQGTTCANAITILPAGSTVVVASINGTLPTGTLCFPSFAMNQAPIPEAAKAKWYKYTPTTSGVITVTTVLDVNPAASTDSRLRILTGTCAALTCVTSNDDVTATDYRSIVTDVSVTAGTTYYIVWDNYWLSTGFTFQTIFTAQTCFKPTAFTYLSAPATTEVGFGWTPPATGTPTGYEIEYGETSFVQGGGTTVNVTDPTITLSNLTPSTIYDFYIRTKCGATDNSVWVGPISFNTQFEVASVPYETSFEATSFPFLGWSTAAAVGYQGPNWQAYQGVAGSVLVQDGARAALVVASATAATDSWIFSRGISLTANAPVTITYYARNYVADNSTNFANYDLKAGTERFIADMTIDIASETGLANDVYELKQYSFTPATTATYYLGFNAKNDVNPTGVHALFIDNLFVDQVVLSVKGVDASKFTVYPNPANNILNISNSVNDLISNVQINDLTGKTVKESNFVAQSSIQMSISDIAAGVYMLTIKTDKGSITKKIVKN
jgi:hypothetical protein